MYVGCALERVQLHFRYTCGAHYRLCTPHALRAEKQLLCPFCTDEHTLLGLHLDAPSALERSMHAGLSDRGLGASLRPQFKPSWWEGCIDFLHYPTGVLIQVDGQHHFSGNMHGLPHTACQGRDLKMCTLAWQAGCILLRAHYLDIEAGTAPGTAASLIQQASAGLQGPCVLLTAGYGLVYGVPPAMVQAQQVWLRELAAALPGARMHTDGTGCVWFTPSAAL